MVHSKGEAKFCHRFLTIVALTTIACTPKNQKSKVIEHKIRIEQSSAVIGGDQAWFEDSNHTIQKSFTSSARIKTTYINTNGSEIIEYCTATRIGPRHFLTSGHCEKSFDRLIEIVSHKTMEKMSFHRSTLSKSEFSPKNDHVSGSALASVDANDWYLLIFDSEKSSFDDTWLMRNFLDTNFDTRELGDPNSIKKGDVVLAAGWGSSNFTGNDLEIFRCLDTEASCTSNENYDQDNMEGELLKRAFFRVDEIMPNFFSSWTTLNQVLVPESYPNAADSGISSFFQTDEKNELGLLAPGDSGGPVVLQKGEKQEMVGIIRGDLKDGSTKPGQLYQIFAKFNKPAIVELLKKPILDFSTKSVLQGESVLISGYRSNDLELRATQTGEKIEPADSCSGLNSRDANRILQYPALIKDQDFSCFKVPANMKPQNLEVHSKNGEFLNRTIDVYTLGTCSKEQIDLQYFETEPTEDLAHYCPKEYPDELCAMTHSTKLKFDGIDLKGVVRVEISFKDGGGHFCIKYLEDASCVVAPPHYNFNLTYPGGSSSFQSDSLQSFRTTDIDVTDHFKEWLKSNNKSEGFPVTMTGVEEGMIEGFETSLKFHTCDPTLVPWN